MATTVFLKGIKKIVSVKIPAKRARNNKRQRHTVTQPTLLARVTRSVFRIGTERRAIAVGWMDDDAAQLLYSMNHSSSEVSDQHDPIISVQSFSITL